jgi:hypothetical protein
LNGTPGSGRLVASRSGGFRVVARLLFALAAAGGFSPSPAAEHSVRPDGLGDFPTIQAAVSAAAAGDTIVLEDGVFTGAG